MVPTLSCASKDSGCAADSQCKTGEVCVAGACTFGGNSCGRPFLVQGVERRAAAEARADWSTALAATAGGELAPYLRAMVCEHYTQAALMEHASIAAFARFSLELLALGAPAELVERTARAMADEIEHARLCFALATQYGAREVGPGPLSLEGCLGQADPVEIFSTAFQEACVGETLAAMEALEAAHRAHDPTLRATLARIAEDEARHAELGWRFVAWMLETSEPQLRAELLHALSALTPCVLEAPSFNQQSESSEARAVSEHGVLAASTRAALRQRTLREVVTPCVASLKQRHGLGPSERVLGQDTSPQT